MVVFVTFALAIGCTSGGSQQPGGIDEAEARALLFQAEEFAAAQDIEGLCGMGGSVLLCQSFWREAGEWEAVPAEDPEIMDSYALESTALSVGQRTGGRILVVTGVDGLGRPFKTDFLVFDAGSHGLVPYNPIYWSGVRISSPGSGDEVTAAPSR